MKAVTALAMSIAAAASPALAQDVNLTGRYQCVQNCVAIEPGRFAFVTNMGLISKRLECELQAIGQAIGNEDAAGS